MNQSADEKALKEAFAEFKELLRRDTEGPDASAAALAPKIELRQGDDAASLQAAPRVYVADPPSALPDPPSPVVKQPSALAKPPASPVPAPKPKDADVIDEMLLAAEGATDDRRHKLMRLSIGIVLAGLLGIGWTLSTWRGPAEEPAIADLAPPEADLASAPVDQAAVGEFGEDPKEGAAPSDAGASPAAEATPGVGPEFDAAGAGAGPCRGEASASFRSAARLRARVRPFGSGRSDPCRNPVGRNARPGAGCAEGFGRRAARHGGARPDGPDRFRSGRRPRQARLGEGCQGQAKAATSTTGCRQAA